MFKVGDRVTQNEYFYESYKSKPFHLKIIKIRGEFVELDGDLLLPNNDSWWDNGRKKRVTTNLIHDSLIKIDDQYIRKIKLRILNDKNSKS